MIGLARAGGHPPGDARGGRRARRAGPCLPGGVGCRLPVARVRRQPPAASVRWCVDDRDDDPRRTGSAAGGVSVPPPLPAGRRAVLYAVRRIGDATVDDVAEALDMTVSGARQHLTSLTEHGLVRAPTSLAADGQRGRPQLSYAASPSSPTRCSPRPTARSPTSCSATSTTRTRTTVDRLFARRRDTRIANAAAPAGAEADAEGQGHRARHDPRRGRLHRDRRDDRAEPLPHRRAQLRDRRRRPTLRAGVHERARVHPDRPSRRRRRAHPAHGRRRPSLRLRDPPRVATITRRPCVTNADDGDRSVSRWRVGPSCRRGAARGRGSRRRGRARAGGSRRAPCWRAPDGP